MSWVHNVTPQFYTKPVVSKWKFPPIISKLNLFQAVVALGYFL
jgi:hypothetical protein